MLLINTLDPQVRLEKPNGGSHGCPSRFALGLAGGAGAYGLLPGVEAVTREYHAESKTNRVTAKSFRHSIFVSPVSLFGQSRAA